MKQKTFLLMLCMTFLILSVGSFIIVYRYDPFFHFHAPDSEFSYILKDNLHSYINPGLAKNTTYETVILGSSMTRAFQPSYIKEVSGENCVKLSIPNAYGKDIKDMFDTAYASGQVQRVILSVDAFAYAEDKDLEANEKPTYLFNENPLDDVQYILNKGVLFDYIPEIILATEKGTPSTTMDEYQNYAKANTFGREQSLRRVQYMSFKDDYEDKSEDYYLQRSAKDNVKQNLVTMIEEHPDVQFDLFIPPYGILKWYNYARSKEVIPYMGLYKYIAEQVIPFDNVSLYFYQGKTEVITNLDNYMDTMHPSETVNRDIVDFMQDKGNALTLENYEEQMNVFQDFILNYDFDPLIEEAWALPSE